MDSGLQQYGAYSCSLQPHLCVSSLLTIIGILNSLVYCALAVLSMYNTIPAFGLITSTQKQD